MPTYNRAYCISPAIDCLLSQTYQNLEFIVSDDASTDNTREICENYAKKDKRVRYIRNEKNLGLAGNFKKALEAAQGEYFIWTPDDDWWDKTFIEKLVAALEENPDYDVAMSHFGDHYADRGGRVFKHNYTGLSYYQVYREMMHPKINSIFVVGLYRREFLNRLMKRSFPKGLGEAWIWLSEVALSTHFYSVPEVLTSKFRQPGLIQERHQYVKDFYAVPLANTRFVFRTLAWLITSTNIPPYRKPLIFVPWFQMFWRYKRKMAKEFLIEIKKYLGKTIHEKTG